MHKPLVIALASDENFIDGLVATLAGVARRAPRTPIRAVILDSGILDATWQEFERTLAASLPSITLQRIVIESGQLDHFAPEVRVCNLNNATYSRLLLPELLPDCDRIIYLDCDVVVDADLRELIDLPLDGALAGAVLGRNLPRLGQNITRGMISPARAALPAFNAGIMLIDLAAFRREKPLTGIGVLLPRLQGEVQSQAILNYILIERWKQLPFRWNRQSPLSLTFPCYRDYPESIWHFNGKTKPWHFDPAGSRGIIADYHRDLASTGWKPRLTGNLRLTPPAWFEPLRVLRAGILRLLRKSSKEFIPPPPSNQTSPQRRPTPSS